MSSILVTITAWSSLLFYPRSPQALSYSSKLPIPPQVPAPANYGTNRHNSTLQLTVPGKFADQIHLAQSVQRGSQFLICGNLRS